MAAGAAGGEPTEVEVKLGVGDPRAVRAALRRPDPARLAGFAAAGPLEHRRITDRYLDTASPVGLLQAAGHRARLRRRGSAVEMTIKRRGVEDGTITERLELTGPATRSRDPRRWPASAARDRLTELSGAGRLVEIAALRQRRLVRNLRRGDTLVEASLDALEALEGLRVTARRWELELELLAGDRGALAELAEAARSLPGVGDAEGSKLDFARGAGAVAAERIDNARLLDSAALAGIEDRRRRVLARQPDTK